MTRTVSGSAVPFARQVEAFPQARGVVASHGAALANLLSVPEGASVTETMPTSWLSGCHAMLAHAVAVDHHAIYVPGAPGGSFGLPPNLGASEARGP